MDEDGVVDTEAAIAMLPDDIRSKVENDIRACGKESMYLHHSTLIYFLLHYLIDNQFHCLMNLNIDKNLKTFFL